MRQNAAHGHARKCSLPRDFFLGRVEIAADLWFAAGMSFAHALRIAREVLRNVFARERLAEEAPPAPSPRPARASLARMLLARETLPLDPEPPRAPRARASSAAETLAEEPVAERAPGRHRWLRWLFRPESLEPHP